MIVDHSRLFRVTRDAEFEIDDEEVEDLLKVIEEGVRRRRRGAAVRLEIEADAPADMVNFLSSALDLDPWDVFSIPGMLDTTALFQIHSLPGYLGLRDPDFVPQPVQEFVHATSPFAAIRSKDIFMHHPYESFGPVVEFIEAAATDDRVLAIKQNSLPHLE